MLKQHTFIFATLCIIGFSTSCKKGWLDVTSSNQIRAEEQFKTPAGYRDALMGVYIGMTEKSMYGMDMTWSLVDILSQQYNPFTDIAVYYTIGAYRYKSISGMAKIDAIWNRSYNTIANINSALSQIDKNKGVLDPIEYSIIKGEFLGLRAFVHFDLMRLYGYGNVAARPGLPGKLAIPYVTNFVKEITPQASYAETFALLQKDVNDALELLKEDPLYKPGSRPANYYAQVNRNGFYNKRELRMNYYAVKALKARLLGWQGGPTNLAEARTAAEEVIAGSPARLITAAAPSSDRLFLPEHIFTLNVNAFINLVNPMLVAESNTDVNALFLLNSVAEELYEVNVPNTGTQDKRYTNLLQDQTRGKVPIKLQQRNESWQTNNLMPLMKAPEMYYIAVEDYIETNPPKAIEYLNLVRRSRGITADLPNNLNKTAVAAELMKEYRKEFIMEGQLFFYYKRLGKTTFPGFPNGIVADDKIYVLPYPDNEVEVGNRVQ